MATHKLHLHAEPFEQVVAGVKTIEARLYDERRQRIDIGDKIVFTNRANNKTVAVKVYRLHRAPTFHELFTQQDPLKFGGRDAESLERAVAQFYNYEDELANGVLGIEFTVERAQ